MSEESSPQPSYSADIEVGEVSVSVEGDEPEEVSQLLDEKLETACSKAEEIGVHETSYHMEGGAGWMVAHGDGDSPEEAYEYWLDMWEQMISDVKKLSAREREQAGTMR